MLKIYSNGSAHPNRGWRPALWRLIYRVRAPLMLALLWLIPTAQISHAATEGEGDQSYVCDQVANLAAAQSGVPISVLKAISLTETGRNRGGTMRPWPWTINMEGQGVWFDNNAEAQAYTQEHFDRGARSFDVGCFQINYKWHHQNFASLQEMFDPVANALYAARYLNELYQEKGNWHDAAGAYHSRTPKFANRYKERFAGYRARFLHEDGLPLTVAQAPVTNALPGAVPSLLQPVQTVPRVNTFPFLQTGIGGNSMGSLVPLNGASGARNLLARSGDSS